MYLGSQTVYTRMQFYRNIYLTAWVHNISHKNTFDVKNLRPVYLLVRYPLQKRI